MGIPARKMTGVCEITTGQMHEVSLPPAFEGEAGAIEVKVTLEYGGAAASVSGLAAGMYLYDPYADTMTDEVEMTLSGNAASGVMPGAFFAACGCPLLCLTLTEPATGRRMVAGSLPLEVQNVCGSSMLTMRAPTPSEVVYIGRAPYIGADNRWWVWDNETHAYRNSGVLCVGTGMASVNGIKADENGNTDVLALNLLDNSDFRNPINQRGRSGVNLSAGEMIDRWKTWADGATVYFNQGLYMGLENQNLFQYISEPYDRGVLTAAVKIYGEDKPYVCTLDTSIVGSASALHVWLTRESHALSICVVAGAVYEWAAVYEGAYTAETLPPYVPKPYAVELAECQRYYVPSSGNAWSLAHIDSVGYMSVFIPTPATMRTSPNTVPHATGFQIYTNAGWIKVDVTLFSVQFMPGGVYLTCNATSVLAELFSDGSLEKNGTYLAQYPPALSCDL